MALVVMTIEAIEDMAVLSPGLRAVYPDFWYEMVDDFVAASGHGIATVRVRGGHLPEEDTRVRLFLYKEETDNYTMRMAYMPV
jgi:hypothetical protein